MNGIGKNILEAKKLNIGYKAKGKIRTISHGLDIEIHAGKMICLLGPNGAGKSTLIKTLAGIHPQLSGTIRLGTGDLNKLTPVEIAKYLSLVLTDNIESSNLTVEELVALGRAPYTGWLGRLSPKDWEKINWAIDETGIEKHRQKRVGELSDGERQTVLIARTLAQDTPLIILDEPTAHLDFPSKIAIFRLLKKLSSKGGKAILLSTHELDLAMQATDKIWLLSSRGEMIIGEPEDLIIDGSFEMVFQKEGVDFDKATGNFRFQKPGLIKVSLIGEGHLAFWTRKALERNGFQISENENSVFKIEIFENKDSTPSWKSHFKSVTQNHDSLKSLLQTLIEKSPSSLEGE